jgi:hypothetical protein
MREALRFVLPLNFVYACCPLFDGYNAGLKLRVGVFEDEVFLPLHP